MILGILTCTGCSNVPESINAQKSTSIISFRVDDSLVKSRITTHAPINIYLDGAYIGVLNEEQKLSLAKGMHSFKFTGEQCKDVPIEIDTIANNSEQTILVKLVPLD